MLFFGLTMSLNDSPRQSKSCAVLASMMPIDLSHINYLEQLPSHHKDPFDRIIIAQAIIEGMSIISIDHAFVDYPVNIVW